MVRRMYLYEKIKARIFDEIISDETNEKLPARGQLMERYGVTRTTIDRTIESLVADGLCTSIQGSGTFINRAVADMGMRVKGSSTLYIGAVISNYFEDPDPLVLCGIRQVLDGHNVKLSLASTGFYWEKQESYIRSMANSGIDGLIISPAVIGEKGYSVFSYLKERKIPFILCNRPVDGINSDLVAGNDFMSAYLSVEYLIRKGCDRIILMFPEMYSITMTHYQGFLSAMAINGYPIDEDDIYFRNPEYPLDWYKYAKDRLSTEYSRIGFYCLTSGIACHVHNAAIDMNLPIGEKVFFIGEEVVASDKEGRRVIANTSAGREMEGSADRLGITSTSTLKYETGRIAAELLMERLTRGRKDSYQTRVVMPKVLERSS